MLFFRANDAQAHHVKHVLDVYAAGTGQLINPSKCSIIFSASCSEEAQGAVRQILGVEQQTFEAKYLGLPTPEGRMHKGKFESLQAKLSKRLIEWGDSLLAQSAREVLIKAIAQAIPAYVMGVFKLPMSVCDDLTRLIRNYWWGSDHGKRKTHWVGWHKLLRSKQQGGMGFRDMRLFNQALLARQAWRLVAFPDSLCARVLRARYYPNGNFVDTVFTGNPSSTWTAISYGLDLLKKGLVWRVGNGRSIRIWRDPWLPRESYMKVLTPRRKNRLRRVSELLDAQGNWNEALVRETFYQVDSDIIMKIKPSQRLGDDILAWQPEKSGHFSVRSAYKLALHESPEQCAFPAASTCPDGRDPCWSKIWKAAVPPKVKVFAWKTASNALATEANKLNRGMQVTGICSICGSEREDIAHALLKCNHAHRLWETMRETWCLPSDADLQVNPESWLRTILQNLPDQMIDTTLLVLWRAWYARNEVTHAKPLPSVEGSKRFLCSYIKILRNIKDQSTEELIKGKHTSVLDLPHARVVYRPKKPPDKVWLKPALGYVKLNCDGSVKLEDGSAGTGMVLRDENGQVIFTACRHLLHCEDALEAEAYAVAEGLKLSLQRSNLPIIVETDYVVLITAINNGSQDRSSIRHIISEIKLLANGTTNVSFVKVDRSQNRVSHCLANFARTESRTMVWIGSGPDCLAQALVYDQDVIPAA
jgi:ribonuclease HI